MSIYVSAFSRRRTTMDRYVRWFLVYLSVHALHVLVVRTYFADQMRLGYFAPYGLLYGPFLYHAYRLAAGSRLDLKDVLTHTAPFWIFLLGYLLWLAVPGVLQGHEPLFGLALYGTLALSLFGYTVWALFFRRPIHSLSSRSESPLLSMMAMVLAFASV